MRWGLGWAVICAASAICASAEERKPVRLDIVFIGDSGPNQPGQKAVAEALNKEWAADKTRVHHIAEYYRGNGFEDWLAKQGESKADIGTHAGIHRCRAILALQRNPRQAKPAFSGKRRPRFRCRRERAAQRQPARRSTTAGHPASDP